LQRAPRIVVDPEGDALPAGFTLLRSSNNQDVAVGGFDVHASQDNVTPTPYLVRGFGQTAGSFSDLFPIVPFGPPQTQTSWGARLLLFEGSYTPGGTQPSIAPGPTVANVFVQASGIATIAATIQQITTGPCDVDCPPAGIPVVGNLGPLTGDMSLNPPNSPTIVAGLVPATDDQLPGTPLAWEFVGAPTGPGVPKKAPTLNPTSGQFSWDVDGSKGGQYVFTVRATDSFPASQGGPFSDTGTVMVNVIVPEPMAFALVGLAIVGVVGFTRRRGERG
jgi:hypothetical protein